MMNFIQNVRQKQAAAGRCGRRFWWNMAYYVHKWYLGKVRKNEYPIFNTFMLCWKNKSPGTMYPPPGTERVNSVAKNGMKLPKKG